MSMRMKTRRVEKDYDILLRIYNKTVFNGTNKLRDEQQHSIEVGERGSKNISLKRVFMMFIFADE